MIDSCEHRQQQQRQRRRHEEQYNKQHRHHPFHRSNGHEVHANRCHHTNDHRSSQLIDASQSHRIIIHRTTIHIWAIVLLVFKQILRTIQTIGKHASNHVETTNQCRWMFKDNVNIGNDTRWVPSSSLFPCSNTATTTTSTATIIINFLCTIFTNVGQITYNFEQQIDAIVRLRVTNVTADGSGVSSGVVDRNGGGRSSSRSGTGCGDAYGSGSGNGSFKSTKHTLLLLTTILICLPIWSCHASAVHNLKYSSNTVKTKYGELRGLIVRNNPTVEAYLGVPYATPPTGSLRLVQFVYIFIEILTTPLKRNDTIFKRKRTRNKKEINNFPPRL